MDKVYKRQEIAKRKVFVVLNTLQDYERIISKCRWEAVGCLEKYALSKMTEQGRREARGALRKAKRKLDAWLSDPYYVSLENSLPALIEKMDDTNRVVANLRLKFWARETA